MMPTEPTQVGRLKLFGRMTRAGRWLFKDETGEEFCRHGVHARWGCYNCAADLQASPRVTSGPSGGNTKRPHVAARKHQGILWSQRGESS